MDTDLTVFNMQRRSHQTNTRDRRRVYLRQKQQDPAEGEANQKSSNSGSSSNQRRLRDPEGQLSTQSKLGLIFKGCYTGHGLILQK